MLDQLVRRDEAVVAIRLVAPSKSFLVTLAEMGVDQEDMDASQAYFGNLDASPESGIEWIFEKRGQRGLLGRFTDGSIPVYYTALEFGTAEAEKAHWLSPEPGVPLYFRPLRVDFSGVHVDLRDLDPVPGFLTGENADGAYVACLAITKEAMHSGFAGFKTPSARAPGGTCFPIIERTAIKAVAADGYVRFDFDQIAMRWVCRRLG